MAASSPHTRSPEPRVLLGTVNIEPNRWGLKVHGGMPVSLPKDWVPLLEDAGFDGLELWERHARSVDADDLAALDSAPVPVVVFNSYASWDPESDKYRDRAARWVERFDATGVKFNVGADPEMEAEFTARLARFDARVPAGVRLICECHRNTLAETPSVALRMFESVGGSDRTQATVHVHPHIDPGLEEALDVLGERVTHVHVQMRTVEPDVKPEDLADQIVDQVELIRDRGAPQTWTIEFSHGVGTDSHDTVDWILPNAIRDATAVRLALRL